MTIYSGYIDPGVKRCALSTFADNVLVNVGFFASDFAQFSLGAFARVVVEKPVIYPGLPDKDLNDLMDLREVVGWLRGSAKHVSTVTPASWKRQTKKHINHWRIWQLLAPHERTLFPADTEQRIRAAVFDGKPYKTATHNLLDATGIGLVILGRSRPGGGAS